MFCFDSNRTVENKRKNIFNNTKMNGILLAMITIYLPRIQAENVYLKQGEENLYSIFAGDTLTMLCPLILPTSSEQIRWSYNNDIPLSIGLKLKLDQANFHFNVSYTNKLKDFIYLRIYNISVNEQMKFKCYYKSQNETLMKYHYNIRLANIPIISLQEKNGQICCAVNGTNINTTDIIWEQRTLFDEHIRFVKSVNIRSPEMSCINISGMLTYITEGKYICNAQVFVKRRERTINGTSSIEIKHKQDRPFCIQDNRIHRYVLSSNISIIENFYSKPEYYNISFKREDGELKLDDNFSVSPQNISLDIFNVTVVVSGYAITINITEFNKEDIGNYTINIRNEFGHDFCTVQLREKEDISWMVETDSAMKRAKEIKYLQWYMMACGSLIVMFVAMYALRSTFLKTVNTCSKPTIRKPSCRKGTVKQATRKQRRAYSDQFMEVTLNQLHNGERILIIGQTNEMDASTETNI